MCNSSGRGGRDGPGCDISEKRMVDTQAGKEPRQCSEVREPQGAHLRLEELQGQNPQRAFQGGATRSMGELETESRQGCTSWVVWAVGY